MDFTWWQLVWAIFVALVFYTLLFGVAAWVMYPKKKVSRKIIIE